MSMNLNKSFLIVMAVVGTLTSLAAKADNSLRSPPRGVETDPRYIDPDGLSSTRNKRSRNPYERSEIHCSDTKGRNHFLIIQRRADSIVEATMNLNRETSRDESKGTCGKFPDQELGNLANASYQCQIGRNTLIVRVGNGRGTAESAPMDRIQFNCNVTSDSFLP